MNLEIAVPQPYNFAQSVRDHGWIGLLPFRWLDEAQALQRIERLDNGRVVRLTITSRETENEVILHVTLDADGSLDPDERAELRGKVRRMLKLDENLTRFYQLAHNQDNIWQTIKSGRGRLLRSPTLFEDVVKTICTTNITWRQTVAMIERLVTTLGDPFPLEPVLRAFPTPAQIAAAGEGHFAQVIRLGYRNGYVLELAGNIVSGQHDPETLYDATEMTTVELKQALKSIKGVGDYAAHTLLMLLGHYHHLPIDSEFRSFVRQRYFNGQPTTDKAMAAIYDSWGAWKGLAYWFDATQ